jgi:hypothetical protein
MDRIDRGLDLIRARLVACDARTNERLPFGNPLCIPAAAEDEGLR